MLSKRVRQALAPKTVRLAVNPRNRIQIAFVCLLTILAINTPLYPQANPERKPKHHKYRLVDVGTLGGPQGYINPEGNGGPYINARGMTVGVAETAVPLHPNANQYLCYPGPNVNHGLRWWNGKTSDLGALSPADENCSDALGINNRGEVAGQSENGVIDPLLGVTEIRAVVWKGGTLVDLGTLGGNASASLGINNRGQVVGFALNDVPDPFSFYGALFEGSSNSTQTRAFLWQEGTMHDLGTLGGPDALAAFVNDSGQIAGFAYTNSTPNPATGIPTVAPFLWQKGKMIDAGTLGGSFGGTLALNNRGQIVGQSDVAGDLAAHPFFWDRGVMIDIGTFGGDNGAANSLNDSGEVVGYADLPGDLIHHAFLWKHGTITDLGTLGMTSIASDINSQGQIVGASRMNDTTIHAFIWEHGQIVDLNDLVFPRSGVQLVEVNKIADSGQIAVNGLPAGCTNGDVCGHPYVLIPDGDCDGVCEAGIIGHENSASLVYSPGASHPEGGSRISSVAQMRDLLMKHRDAAGRPRY